MTGVEQQQLAARDYASKQALDAALAARDQSKASVQGAQAAVEAAEAHEAVLKAQQEEARRTLEELAKGNPALLRTREAKASVERLRRPGR